MVVPARRDYQHFFGGGPQGRGSYAQNQVFESRNAQIPFAQRIAQFNRERKKFDDLLTEVVGREIQWHIDKSSQGQSYIKVKSETGNHGSEGLGHGIVSLFVVLDSLYDSNPGDIIVIDEPENSLHPQILKRLKGVFLRYALDRQLVISTHSPYLIDWQGIADGAGVVRTVATQEGIKTFALSDQSRKKIASILKDKRNPHILGLDASDIFFQEDGILILEGLDDVIYLDKVLSDLNLVVNYHVFGWGAGGKSNVQVICQILADLGYKKVAAILDNDAQEEIEKLRVAFSDYHFELIPAGDIRTKKAVKAKEEKKGLLNEDYKVRECLRTKATEVFTSIREYFEP